MDTIVKMLRPNEVPPTNVVELIDWLQRKLESVPPELRHTCELEYDPYVAGGDAFNLVLMRYYVPEKVAVSPAG